MALLIAGVLFQERGTTPATEQYLRPEGWTEETHGDDVDPNYKIVFPQDQVNRMKITISPDDWEAMQANMTDLLGAPGTNQQVDTKPESPIWVPAKIEFNGLIWNNVGIRYRGSSTLIKWGSGTLKIPLRFNFDKFEDKYPEIKNQRFHGFKKLAMANAIFDPTYMRDVIMSDVLAEAGLVAAETAYYEIVMDYGEGPVNLGLYVAIEVIEHTVIERYFGDKSGNIYKGQSVGVSLAEGTFDLIRHGFVKKNNETEADWGDIEKLYAILHSKERISDPEAWQESLESVFNVDVFLKWLAISAVIEHWDTYGDRPDNFYLYNDPDSELLTWISWDHDMILGIVGEGKSSASLGREEIGRDWPLIRYLLDDPIYYNRYVDYIRETIEGPFDPAKLEVKCRTLAELIAPYIAEESGEAAFESGVERLINRIYERYQVAGDFLDTWR
ncbi:MAG: CotH kinase family protein [Dehalococcoidales bacterium]|nr:CotH kinase family protein [Dehalococcoidales bacterium]